MYEAILSGAVAFMWMVFIQKITHVFTKIFQTEYIIAVKFLMSEEKNYDLSFDIKISKSENIEFAAFLLACSSPLYRLMVIFLHATPIQSGGREAQVLQTSDILTTLTVCTEYRFSHLV